MYRISVGHRLKVRALCHNLRVIEISMPKSTLPVSMKVTFTAMAISINQLSDDVGCSYMRVGKKYGKRYVQHISNNAMRMPVAAAVQKSSFHNLSAGLDFSLFEFIVKSF